jgi:hypothetical protein
VALPRLGNPKQLAARLAREATDADLLSELDKASSAFRTAVGHVVTLGQDLDYEALGHGGSSLLLPGPYPIVVDETHPFTVSIDGEELDATTFTLYKRAGIVTRKSGRIWPAPPAAILVTFWHGYTATAPTGTEEQQKGYLVGLPESIQDAVLERAEHGLAVALNVASQTVLGDTIAFRQGETQTWTDAVAAYGASWES